MPSGQLTGEAVVAELIGQATAIGSARTTQLLMRVIRRVEQTSGATTALADAAGELRRILAA